MRPICASCLFVCILSLAGCHEPDEPEPRQPIEAHQDATSRSFRFPVAAPVADSLAVREMVQRNAGHPVLMCFWSRFTDQHRVELQRLAELQRRRGPAGLRVISINTDEPDDWIGYTRPTLLSVSANYPTVIVTPDTRSSLRTWLNPKWNYDTPARFLFDGGGQVTGSYVGDDSFAAAEAAVSEAVGTSALPVYEPRSDTYDGRRSRYVPRADRGQARGDERRPARGDERRPARGDERRASEPSSPPAERTGADASDDSRTDADSRQSPDLRQARDSGIAPDSRGAAGRIAVRTGVGLRLINVREGVIEGNYESQADDVSDAVDALAAQIAARLGGGSSRVALLPLGNGDYGAAPSEHGLIAAERLTRSLRLGGVSGALTPDESAAAFAATGLSPGKAATEPTLLRGKLAADYLVVGWCGR